VKEMEQEENNDKKMKMKQNKINSRKLESKD
jgi:hypothetical protein